MLLWALVFGISGYAFASPGWGVFFWLTPTHFISNVLSMIISDQMTFLFVTAVELAGMLLGVQIAALLRRQRLSLLSVRKAFVVALAAVIAIDGAIAFQLVQRDRSYVSQYENAEKIGSKIDYGDYYSFLVDNKLEVLQEKPDVMLGAIDFYAVTAWTSNPNVPVLLDWLQGRQGQAFIEQCGYVGIAR